MAGRTWGKTPFLGAGLNRQNSFQVRRVYPPNAARRAEHLVGRQLGQIGSVRFARVEPVQVVSGGEQFPREITGSVAHQLVLLCHAFEANAAFLDSAVAKLRSGDEYAGGCVVGVLNIGKRPYRRPSKVRNSSGLPTSAQSDSSTAPAGSAARLA